MALSKEEMRRKLLELSESDRDGLAEALRESLVEKRKTEEASGAEQSTIDRLKSVKPN